jgi:TldD protein
MRAMLVELSRSARDLEMDAYGAPYFVAYTIKDLAQLSIGAKLGALYERSRTRQRRAYVDVRVGSYALDSSEHADEYYAPDEAYQPSSAIPVEAQEEAIRHTLWLMTDAAYKHALGSFLSVQAERVYRPVSDPTMVSFSSGPPVEHADTPLELKVNEARWRELARTLSALVGANPHVFDSEVLVDFRVLTRWLINSEGVRIRTVHPIYAIHVSAATRAADGLVIEHSYDAYAPAEGALPTNAVLMASAQTMLDQLMALREAPVLEPYTGPAILGPTATGVFFHEVLGHRLEGHRQGDDEEGQTFAGHLGQRILPEFLSLYDDPTLAAVEGIPLNGVYQYDDEGIASRRVTLVRDGVLEGFLMTRRPVKGFDASNGHARAEGVTRPTARMGNLLVEARDTVSFRRLKQRLLDEVRRQGKPFGLFIRDLTGGMTNTSSHGYQAFKGEARLVYKVDAVTGVETLVRGVDLVGTPLTSISKIIAASDDTGVFNGYCGAESGMVPVSTVAPATLFREIELQRSIQSKSRGSILSRPSASGGHR